MDFKRPGGQEHRLEQRTAYAHHPRTDGGSITRSAATTGCRAVHTMIVHAADIPTLASPRRCSAREHTAKPRQEWGKIHITVGHLCNDQLEYEDRALPTLHSWSGKALTPLGLPGSTVHVLGVLAGLSPYQSPLSGRTLVLPRPSLASSA